VYFYIQQRNIVIKGMG